MENLPLGFLFVVLGALCGGSWALPSKYADPKTPWEVLWGPFFFLVTLIIPTIAGPIVAKDIVVTWQSVSPWAIVGPLVFGFLWGTGSMTYGIAFSMVGLSLAYAINSGTQVVFGWLMPLFVAPNGFAKLATLGGIIIVVGVVVAVVGVAICGYAGVLKSRGLAGQNASAEDKKKGSRFILGLLVTVASGILCACASMAFAVGDEVKSKSMALGNPSWAAGFVVWMLVLWAGAFSAFGYCVYKLCKNKTWPQLKAPGIGKILALALAMALLHDGAIFFFGLAFTYLNGSVAYAAFMCGTLIIGNVHGFRTREWQASSQQAVRWILIGIAVLLAAIITFATGTYVQSLK